MSVTYIGRKILSCSQLDTISLSPVFIHASLKEPIFCANIIPAVLYEPLNQVAQLIPSGQVMLSLEILFWVGCWTRFLEGSTVTLLL